MANSCFFPKDGKQEKRPDAPFARTKLQNVVVGSGKQLKRNNIAVAQAEAKKYLLSNPDRIVGNYPLAFHHSIPFNLLKARWNPIVTFCTEDAIGALFDFYASDHPATVRNKPQVEGLRAKIMPARARLGPALPAAGGQFAAVNKTCEVWFTEADAAMKAGADNTDVTKGEAEDPEITLCWGAWNLTEGPAVTVEDRRYK